MAICEKCIKQSVCKLCDGTEIMGCIEFVSLNKVIMNGQPLPDDCEILTREAYADLCLRASKEPNCSEIPTGSTAKIDVPDNNVENIDCISRADVDAVIEQMRVKLKDGRMYILAEVVQDIIRELPSVTSIRPKGHWIEEFNDLEGEVRFTCSSCGKYQLFGTDFCYYCGSDNREVEK